MGVQIDPKIKKIKKKACQKSCEKVKPKKGSKKAILDASWIFKSADGGGGGLASEAGKVLVLFNLTTPRHRPVSADFGIPGKSKMDPKPHF